MHGINFFSDNQNMKNPVMGDTMLYYGSGKRMCIAIF